MASTTVSSPDPSAWETKPVEPMRKNPKVQYTKLKINDPSAIAPRDAVDPVRPITAVSANPKNGVAELARMIGQVRLMIVR